MLMGLLCCSSAMFVGEGGLEALRVLWSSSGSISRWVSLFLQPGAATRLKRWEALQEQPRPAQDAKKGPDPREERRRWRDSWRGESVPGVVRSRPEMSLESLVPEASTSHFLGFNLCPPARRFLVTPASSLSRSLSPLPLSSSHLLSCAWATAWRRPRALAVRHIEPLQPINSQPCLSHTATLALFACLFIVLSSKPASRSRRLSR